MYEEPLDLLGRLKIGREEFCQRLLTSLIVGGAYPRWDSRNAPSPAGVEYLRLLDEVSFGTAGEPAVVFVDEFLLPARTDAERGGSPDQAVLWPDRLWLIELKTEPASHRHDQLPSYFDLAGHHYPGARVDITYLTPAMRVAAPEVTAPNRYAHVTWAQAAVLVDRVWGSSPDLLERRLAQVLQLAVGQLDVPAPGWRERLVADRGVTGSTEQTVDAGAAVWEEAIGPTSGSAMPSTPTPAAVRGEPHGPVQTPADWVSDALSMARDTAVDGRQRAIQVEAASLDDLLELRLLTRDRIDDLPEEAPERFVLPWLWRAATSTGTALTPEGARTGFEVRLSRYQRRVI